MTAHPGGSVVNGVKAKTTSPCVIVYSYSYPIIDDGVKLIASAQGSKIVTYAVIIVAVGRLFG